MKKEALTKRGLASKGLMHLRRTVGLAIPCRVASPQSPTPFHQVEKLSINNPEPKIFLDERRAFIEGCVKRTRADAPNCRTVRLREYA
jgi:hypothetical protein